MKNTEKVIRDLKDIVKILYVCTWMEKWKKMKLKELCEENV